MRPTTLIEGYEKRPWYYLGAFDGSNYKDRVVTPDAVNYIFVPEGKKGRVAIHSHGEKRPTFLRCRESYEAVNPAKTSVPLLKSFADAGIELLQISVKGGKAHIVPSKVVSITERDYDGYSTSPTFKFYDGTKIKSNRPWDGPESLKPWSTETPATPNPKLKIVPRCNHD